MPALASPSPCTGTTLVPDTSRTPGTSLLSLQAVAGRQPSSSGRKGAPASRCMAHAEAHAGSQGGPAHRTELRGCCSAVAADSLSSAAGCVRLLSGPLSPAPEGTCVPAAAAWSSELAGGGAPPGWSGPQRLARTAACAYSPLSMLWAAAHSPDAAHLQAQPVRGCRPRRGWGCGQRGALFWRLVLEHEAEQAAPPRPPVTCLLTCSAPIPVARSQH